MNRSLKVVQCGCACAQIGARATETSSPIAKVAFFRIDFITSPSPNIELRHFSLCFIYCGQFGGLLLAPRLRLLCAPCGRCRVGALYTRLARKQLGHIDGLGQRGGIGLARFHRSGYALGKRISLWTCRP